MGAATDERLRLATGVSGDDVDAASVALRTERDAAPIGGKRRLAFVRFVAGASAPC
jgi:hypothetical protein